MVGWRNQWKRHARVRYFHRLTPSGQSLFEQVMPAWRTAQRKAHKLLGEAGVRALNRFASEIGFGV